MYYQVEKFDGYYRIGSPEAVFCYLITGSKKAMLIDTGYCYGNLKETVASLTDLPLVIVNTHGHCDHTGGNAQFGIPCYIHEQDMKLCREHNSPKVRASNAERAKHSVHYETGEEYNALPEDFDEEAYSQMGCGILQPVSEGMVFDLGGATMEMLETPGHTRGCISVLYREKNILFIGDITGMFVWMFAPETTSLNVYIQTLEKLYALNADAYIGGHNPDAMHREDLLLYKRAAEEADYEKGEPFESFMAQECEPRVCALDGKTLKDMFTPGFAAVVLGKN
ncbi:MAG: MBL fold metallo-hydrolase [Clostridiales bacterium]|nr:MBL fold metallo-hydrolase [Clostridiales bacterium]